MWLLLKRPKLTTRVKKWNATRNIIIILNTKVTFQSLALMKQSRQSRALKFPWKSQTTVNRILRDMNGWLEKSRTGQAWARNSSSARVQTGCMVTIGWRAEEHKMMCYWRRNAPHNDTNVWSGLWFAKSARNLKWWLEMATDCEWWVGSGTGGRVHLHTCCQTEEMTN